MTFFYNIFVAAYRLGVKIAATRNPKAAEWVAGRQRLWQELEQQVTPGEPLIWIHSSSAGEFEQAKPVIERLKAVYPSYKVLVTFFSPSGYNAARRYKGADFRFYLPEDTAAHAERFLKAVRPALVVFVKYDFWYHHLHAVRQRNIPLLLISAVFRPGQPFFKWYGGFYRRMLHFFSRIFVQDPPSLRLLQEHGISHCGIGGDTRFDRVITACAQSPRPGQHGTWITSGMRQAYIDLHRQGYAHSVEVFEGDTLAGGIYGVAVGRMFFGESMFSGRSGGSKVALAALARRLSEWGWPLIDAQVENSHLHSLGGCLMRRADFLRAVADLVDLPSAAGSWTQRFGVLQAASLSQLSAA